MKRTIGGHPPAPQHPKSASTKKGRPVGAPLFGLTRAGRLRPGFEFGRRDHSKGARFDGKLGHEVNLGGREPLWAAPNPHQNALVLAEFANIVFTQQIHVHEDVVRTVERDNKPEALRPAKPLALRFDRRTDRLLYEYLASPRRTLRSTAARCISGRGNMTAAGRRPVVDADQLACLQTFNFLDDIALDGRAFENCCAAVVLNHRTMKKDVPFQLLRYDKTKSLHRIEPFYCARNPDCPIIRRIYYRCVHKTNSLDSPAAPCKCSVLFEHTTQQIYEEEDGLRIICCAKPGLCVDDK